MKDLSFCSQFTEMKLKQNLKKRTIFLSQNIYIEKALEYANMTKSKQVYFSIVFRINFQKNTKESVDKEFIDFY